MTKLSPSLPKEHGLYGPKLVKEPEDVHVVIALVDCSKVTKLVDTGDTEPTLRILRMELINDADLPDAHLMLRHAIEKRTGATVLDGFEDDIDQDMKRAFGGAET